MEIIYDGNIIHRSKGRLHQNSPVECLLAFLDDHAVAGELLTAEGGLDGIHFGIVDGDAQEVLKACSGKFTPIHQFMYYDAFEALPDRSEHG